MTLATAETGRVASGSSDDGTLSDLLRRLGDISPDRVLLNPPPGQATEADVVSRKNCELIDGVLVEMAMGWGESAWGFELGAFIGAYLKKNRIAIIAGADGLTKLSSGRVRIPDVGVYLLSRFPSGKAPAKAICDIAPDWAIEIVSRSNTAREMQIKREQFFAAGTRRMWIVDPRKRTIEDWTSAKTMQLLGADDVVDVGEILPGFTLNIGDWFHEMDQLIDNEGDVDDRDSSR